MKHEIVDGSPIDPAQLRRALGCFPTGVCVITCRSDDGLDMGMTVSSVNSLSLTPPLKLFSIRKAARSLPAWQAAQGLVINVLAQDQGWISDRFARPAEDRWKDVAFTRGIADAPVIDGVVAAFECAPHATVSTGDHMLFIVNVVGANARPETAPLVFHRSRYCSVREEAAD